ncbi:MAG: hypothetical protein Q4Q58_04550 [Thermoplasmata archaeon]|nr:hypothetical protein [Thermoplasmata archaeon]
MSQNDARARSDTLFEKHVSGNQDLTFETAERVFSDADIPLDEGMMATLGFRSGHLYTNLALLMSDQCPAGMKLSAYSDRSMTGFLGRAEVDGSVLTHVRDAMAFIDGYNPLRSRISGIRRTDFRAYPEAAVGKALTNAVVRRDYSMHADTLVSVLGDGVSVTSYGAPMPRNQGLADVFRMLGFDVSGIPGVMDGYEDALLKPWTSVSTNVLRIELPAVSPAVEEQEDVDAIMELARTRAWFSRADAETRIGYSKTKTVAILTGMVDEGLLNRIGRGRGTRYRIRVRIGYGVALDAEQHGAQNHMESVRLSIPKGWSRTASAVRFLLAQ